MRPQYINVTNGQTNKKTVGQRVVSILLFALYDHRAVKQMFTQDIETGEGELLQIILGPACKGFRSMTWTCSDACSEEPTDRRYSA